MGFMYNGITLTPIHTNLWRQQAIMSEDGLQYHFTRHLIDVTCLYNPSATTSGPGNLPPQTNTDIRKALMTPRGFLSWDLGGHTFLTSPIPDDPCDAEGGPTPLDCVVTQVTGCKTWHVRFVLRTSLSDCPPDQRPLMLSNQYSDSHTIDEQYRTVITCRGRAVFDLGRLEGLGKFADQLRHLLLPPVPPGFRPIDVKINVLSNRYTIDWSATYQEQFYNLGDTVASGSYIVKADVDFTSLAHISPKGEATSPPQEIINVKLWGDKRASEFTMIERAFKLAATKIPFNVPGVGVDTVFIQSISVFQKMTDRFIQLQIACVAIPPINPVFLGIRVVDLKKDPGTMFPDFAGVNPGLPWGKGSRGTYNAAIDVQALKAACVEAFTPTPDQTGNVSGSGQQAGPPSIISVQAVDELPVTVSFVAPTLFPYTAYQVEIERKRDEHTIMCPVAGPVGSQAAFFTLAAATTRFHVAYTAERLGSLPVVPTPKSSDPNLVLLKSNCIGTSPKLLPDCATPVYRVTGFIEWGCKQAPASDAPLYVGMLPWTALPTDALRLPTEAFSTGVVDDPNGTASGTSPVGPMA